MSFADGMAAINLEMPDRIPRTEYSAHFHWPLVQTVTGLPVGSKSSPEEQQAASSAFLRAWDYGMFWNVLTNHKIFGDKRTDMGHASYAADGVDFSAETHALFSDPEEVYSFDLFEQFGAPDKKLLTAEYDENYREMCEKYPDTVNMTGIYVTCISGILELCGWDTLLCAAGIDPKAFGDFVNRYCAWIGQYFDALAGSAPPVVMIHDDIVWTQGAFLHPDFYRAFVFPNYKKLFAPLIDAGKRILFTSDGNYTEFIDDIAGCGVHGFVLEPITDMKYIAEHYGKTHVIVGNADTGILLMGSREEIEAEVRRCMDIGRDCPGFILAVGNHIPPNTPVENALWYNEVYTRLSRR